MSITSRLKCHIVGSTLRKGLKIFFSFFPIWFSNQKMYFILWRNISVIQSLLLCLYVTVYWKIGQFYPSLTILNLSILSYSTQSNSIQAFIGFIYNFVNSIFLYYISSWQYIPENFWSKLSQLYNSKGKVSIEKKVWNFKLLVGVVWTKLGHFFSFLF